MTIEPSPSRALDAHIAELAASLPGGTIVVGDDRLEKYRNDAIRDVTAGWPALAARPTSTAEVQECLQWAHRHGVPVVIRGAGTGLSGGARAVDGCLVLTTERMRAITIDPDSRIAVVQPGALNVEVKDAAEAEGLFYPPDPASFRISSIGGNIATNAGGLCCVRYGVTAGYVLGVTMVLGDGRVVELGGRTIKNVAGLSLTSLAVGSEGTLGVIVEATLRLVPPPRTPVTLAMTFPTFAAAGRTVVESGRLVVPSLMELLTRQTINLVEDHRPSGLDRTAAALVIAQVSDVEDGQTLASIAQRHGATEVHLTEDRDAGDMFVEIRRSAATALEGRGAVLPEDVAVPLAELPRMLTYLEGLAGTSGVEISVVAHAGDGNLHPTIVYDASDARQVVAAHAAFEDIARTAIALGGTITGEHGIGRAKLHLLEEQVGSDVLALSQCVKSVFDPGGILNPGVGY